MPDRIRGTLTLSFALGALAACGSEPGGPGEDGTASVRLMHAAAGASALDLVVGGQVVAGGIRYEHASAPTLIAGGTRTVAIRKTGEAGALLTRTVALAPGGRYAMVVSGSQAALVLTPSVVVDTGLARPDRANLRIINVSTVVMPQDSSAMPPPIPLNVVITAPGVPLAGAGSQLSLDARISSYSTLLYFDPGTYVVRFVTPGTTTVVAETAAIPIAAGQVRAVTLQRLADGSWRTSVVAEE